MKIGRNAGTGKFTTVSLATRYPRTHVVETVDTGNDKGGSGGKGGKK